MIQTQGMRKLYWIVFPALLLTVPAFWFFQLPAPPPDPVYQGKRLSKWLEQMDIKDTDSTVCMEAGAAILLIDPTAAARVRIFEDPHIIR
jgi:hypothetical protein